MKIVGMLSFHSDFKKLDLSSELFSAGVRRVVLFSSSCVCCNTYPHKKKGGGRGSRKVVRLILRKEITVGQISNFLFSLSWELNPVA